MQSSVQNLEALAREMTVTVPAETVSEVYKSRLKEVAKKADIKGFRPGKVPTDVVEQRYRQGLLEEVASQLIQTHFEKAIVDNALRVAGQPTITDMTIKKDEPFEFKAKFEIYPEIELTQLSGKSIERESATVTDADLEEMLKKIQTQQATYEVVERAAQDTDRVTIDFEGSVDGDVFEGGSAKEHTLILGSGSMIPGFESGIEGMQPGETRSIDVTFPEDYQAEDLKGKAAVFKIVLHKVEAPELPALDDALAEKMQVEGGLDALKLKVREGMERELKDQLKARLKERVLDALLDANSIEIPESLVAAEVQHLKKMSLNRMAQQYGMPVEQLEKLNLPDDPYKEQADKRVRLGLLLAEVITAHEIKSDEARLKAQVKEIASHYQKSDEVEQWYFNNKEALSEVEAALIEEIAVEKLLESASVTDKDVTYKDVVGNEQT